jgi:very-short-patch-repair endonuclease
VELERALAHRNHQFEFPIEDRVFDLALLDVGVLVEFDGPYHSSPSQMPRDEEKDDLARRYGFVVVRKAVVPASIIGVETIRGL